MSQCECLHYWDAGWNQHRKCVRRSPVLTGAALIVSLYSCLISFSWCTSHLTTVASTGAIGGIRVSYPPSRAAKVPHRVPLADVPRMQLDLPEDKYIGSGYDIIRATVHCPVSGNLTLNLMLDSGLSTSMLLPKVADALGLERKALTVTAANSAQTMFNSTLDNIMLAGTNVSLGAFCPLIVDFPQASIGDDVGVRLDGMLGMELYERFGVEVDGDRIRLYAPDGPESAAATEALNELTTVQLPHRLRGIGVEAFVEGGGAPKPRVLGILDTGASHTVLNWAAAKELYGLEKEEALEKLSGIQAFDLSGKPFTMPSAMACLELRGAGRTPRGVATFEPVEITIGDIALFAKILKGDTSSPAALIGQDLLTQRPMLLAAKQQLLCFAK